MKIFNTRIYGFNESLIAAGYPMVSDEVSIFPEFEEEFMEDNLNRGKRLGTVPSGTGHDCVLKGIIVQFDITYPQYWSMQFQRYHFADIISSTSKMHKLTKMDIKNNCNEYVDDVIIENLNKWIDIYNNFPKESDVVSFDFSEIMYHNSKRLTDDNKLEFEWVTKHDIFMKIISNTPMGFEQTMRVTTSYLQLKTIFKQRIYHKLDEWKYFCNWCEESLPYFKELCIGD